ncbi:MAG TPA: hypothetical protein VMW29_02205 [Candidatus Bathyarchaeia archaeon]|nr:hypothetical protein [Candidatus Bathyarchaeia archaeon]
MNQELFPNHSQVVRAADSQPDYSLQPGFRKLIQASGPRTLEQKSAENIWQIEADPRTEIPEWNIRSQVHQISPVLRRRAQEIPSNNSSGLSNRVEQAISLVRQSPIDAELAGTTFYERTVAEQKQERSLQQALAKPEIAGDMTITLAVGVALFHLATRRIPQKSHQRVSRLATAFLLGACLLTACSSAPATATDVRPTEKPTGGGGAPIILSMRVMDEVVENELQVGGSNLEPHENQLYCLQFRDENSGVLSEERGDGSWFSGMVHFPNDALHQTLEPWEIACLSARITDCNGSPESAWSDVRLTWGDPNACNLPPTKTPVPTEHPTATPTQTVPPTETATPTQTPPPTETATPPPPPTLKPTMAVINTEVPPTQESERVANCGRANENTCELRTYAECLGFWRGQKQGIEINELGALYGWCIPSCTGLPEDPNQIPSWLNEKLPDTPCD